MLCRLCFLFTNGSHNRYKRNVDEGDILSANTELELAKGFQVWGAFDIANCTAKFDDAHIGCLFTSISGSLCNIDDPILNSIGNMWNNLDGFPEIITATLCFKNLRVDLSGSEVVISSKIEVKETLIVSEVEIDFAAIIENEDFTVFERTHRPCIAVEVGVNFDRGYSQSSTLEKNADATCCNTFAQSTEHPPADNYVSQTYQRDFKRSRIPYQYWL